MDYCQLISTALSGGEDCGVNLEDDSGFQRFFFEAEGTPEKYDGQKTIPAEPPEWRSIKKQALEYLSQTKDLKLIGVLAQAVLNTEGIIKFAECVAGIDLAVETFWQDIYPPLDEDDGDPMERISALGYLSNKTFCLDVIRNTPLASSKILGHITLKNIDNANDSSIEKASGDLDITQIKAIFKDQDKEELQALHQATQKLIINLNHINQSFEAKSGNQYLVNFDDLLKILNHISTSIEKYAELKVQQTAPLTEETAEHSEQSAGQTNTNGQNRLSFSGDNMTLTSRQDVEKCIDLICQYYAEHEPSSPLPLLLKRAKKLINLEFIEIVKEIAPEALEQLNKLGGLSNQE